MNSESSHSTFTELLSEWLRTSKTHGLDRLVISRSSILKMVWIVSLTASIGICSFLISRIVLDYLRFEVKSRIREVYVSEVDFPKVSVCNYNPLVTKEANDYIKNYFERNFNKSVSKFPDFYLNYQTPELFYELGYLFYQTLDPEFNKTLKKSFGYNYLDCKYYGVDCTPDYRLIYENVYGNCVLINSRTYANGSARESRYKAYLQDYGMDVLMFLGPSETESSYLFDSSGQKGMMIRVDDVDYDGVMLNGVAIMPGTQAQITLKRTETHKMPYPYSNCVPNDQVDTKAARYMKQLGVKYNRRSCMYMCYQMSIVGKIGCNNMQIAFAVPGYPFCKTKEQYNNMSLVQFNLAQCTDLCPIECDLVSYDMSVSYANFPSYDTFYELLQLSSENFSDIFETKNISYDMFRKTIAGSFKFKFLIR